MSELKRCGWVDLKNSLYVEYHDQEWGVPVFNDTKLFEMLILEGAQAGLSWSTILKKRENYRRAFEGFDVKKVSQFSETKINSLMNNEGIVRNKLKINSAIRNAKVVFQIQKEFGSFHKYIWYFINGKPIQNSFKHFREIPPRTEISDTISRDLKKRGMNFVGSTIIYAFMQAVGIVNDHEIGCFRYREIWSIEK